MRRFLPTDASATLLHRTDRGDPLPWPNTHADGMLRHIDTTPPARITHFHRRRDLVAEGWTDRALRAAVVDGRLLRPRFGAYLSLDAETELLEACALGGRLACVSELARHGVFVLDKSALHVHLHSDRAKSPKSSRSVRRHWGRLHRTPHPCSTSVELFDAVLCAVRCQPPRAALATLDSALRHGVIGLADLDELFRALPRRHRVLHRLIEPRAESGPETLFRLIVRSLGVRFEIQVDIAGVGRVDFVVDGWLIVECDSEQFHSTWEDRKRDLRRDQAAAALGYSTYRPIAEDIMWQSDRVRAALRGLLAAGRRRRGSSPAGGW